ncbi:MAG: hypothetical protein CVU11_04315 [Bacteroidetes bacterium HGW-Bacteroidetes-6]|jgi:hypothetical protein|nr:MAG: hypothetical protein CVU11_04315 [Bacteroidetes bacterium HGW-Bacteroidetes-6]
MKIDFKKALPYLIAFGTIMIVLLVMFYPALQGKTIAQEDIKSWNAASKEARDYHELTGQQAYWAGTMFGGMPVYQITIQHVGNLFLQVDKLLTLYMPFFMGYIFLAFVGFFFMITVLKLNKWAALAGAIAFALSSYFMVVLQAGHNAKAHAMAYMAPYLIAIYLTYRGKYLKGGLLAAVVLALELSCNHIQITYYLAFTVLIFVIFEAVWAVMEKQFKRFLIGSAVLLLGVVLAIGVNFSNLYTTYEYSKETIRGKSELSTQSAADAKGLDKTYIYGWSYGIGETWSLMIPNIKGGASQQIKIDNKAKLSGVDQQARKMVGDWSQYWGEQPGTSGPVYVGAIVMFFFVLGMIIVKHRLKWPMLIAGAFSIMLAWGGNFTFLSDFFVDNLPMLNKFRAPSMWLVIAELVIPFIFVLALHELITNNDKLKERMNALYIAFGLTGGIAFIFWLMPTMFFGFISGAEQQSFDNYRAQGYQIDDFVTALTSVRIAIFKADALRSFLFILAGGFLTFLLMKKKIKAPLFIGLIIGLVFIDLVQVDKRYLNESHFEAKRKAENPFTPSAADQMIIADNTAGARVLNLSVSSFMDATTSYYHRSTGGYHAAKLIRYQELIENQISPEISLLGENLKEGTTMGRIDTVLSHLGVLNMLDTKYIILDPSRPPLVNSHALGHVWFVDSYMLVQNADEEIQRVGEIDPHSEAVIDKRYESALNGLSIQSDSTATIERVSYNPNELIFKSNAASSQLAVFSEIWYPEWELYIDGNKTDLIRADYVLRAAVIPAGSHDIVMKIHPKAFLMSTKVSFASSLLLLLMIAGFFVKLYFDSKKKKTAQQ